MSIRAQLASKKPHVEKIQFPRGEAGEKALKKLNAAQQVVDLQRLLLAKGQTVDEKAAEAAVKRAELAYAKASITLEFRGLTPDEHSALADEFTVPDLTPEQVEAGEAKPDMDLRAYTCALVAVVTLDSDLTAKEWQAELYESGRWSLGEVAAIRETAQAAYMEVAAPGIPKGFGLTRS